ncbi:unnamed protein product [Agarophyton chilense]
MLSNHAYHNMNRLAIRNNRENERRLLEELERISSDKHRAPALTHSVFSPESFALDCSPILSPLSLDAHNDAMHLDFDHPQSFQPYTHFDTEPSTVQVDHTGELSHFPTSTWVASSLSSPPPSATVSSTSSTLDRSSTPLHACVAAAAATAAIIVVPDTTANCKRPRSPSSFLLDGDQSPDNHTDHSMHSESEQSHDPTSPRIIQHFGNAQTSPVSIAPQQKHPVRTVQTKASIKPPADHPSTSVHTCSSDAKKLSSVSSSTVATDADLSRKRRAEAMERFRRKKAVRCYARRVRYQVRKRIATTRPRVNGRFARRVDAVNHAAKSTT